MHGCRNVIRFGSNDHSARWCVKAVMSPSEMDRLNMFRDEYQRLATMAWKR
jgi:hypothetical protein